MPFNQTGRISRAIVAVAGKSFRLADYFSGLLSIVACDQARDVPHFHAKKVAEDLIRTSGLPYVFIRAPAFLDQADDYLAKGMAKRRFYGVGDRDTRWSYVLTDDLAQVMAQAATHPDPAILNQTIDISWRDGPQNQRDL